MDEQTTFRLPPALARALARRARERGVPKSQLVREALERYLAQPPVPDVHLVRERTAPYLGALQLDETRLESDDVARLIRDRNWRR
jgi:predicted DNA-binding protein